MFSGRGQLSPGSTTFSSEVRVVSDDVGNEGSVGRGVEGGGHEHIDGPTRRKCIPQEMPPDWTAFSTRLKSFCSRFVASAIKKPLHRWRCKGSLASKRVEPAKRVELLTDGLRNRCSTTELRWQFDCKSIHGGSCGPQGHKARNYRSWPPAAAIEDENDGPHPDCFASA